MKSFFNFLTLFFVFCVIVLLHFRSRYVIVNSLVSQRCSAVTTKPAALKNTHLSPESRDVDTEDRGVFEGLTKKAQGQHRKKN